jgi:hypothetical protein
VLDTVSESERGGQAVAWIVEGLQRCIDIEVKPIDLFQAWGRFESSENHATKILKHLRPQRADACKIQAVAISGA